MDIFKLMLMSFYYSTIYEADKTHSPEDSFKGHYILPIFAVVLFELHIMVIYKG